MNAGFTANHVARAVPTSTGVGGGAATVHSPAASSWLLDAVLSASGGAVSSAGTRDSTRLERFLDERNPLQAIAIWLAGRTPATGRQLLQLLALDLAQIDDLLTAQINAILHQPQFQRLESAWRGLRFLVDQARDGANVKIRVLNVAWKELARDFERASEFDQSSLFKKVYGAEFGTPGGEPFGVLIGDYEIHPSVSADHNIDDVSVLTGVAQVAAAAFAPFIGAAHPSLFGIDEFSVLEQPLDIARTFDQLEYLRWRAFREMDDSRFIGLTLPRVLSRLPYADDGSRVDGFRFCEDVAGPDRRNYLWGNAAFAYGAVLLREFAETGWLADIRGVRRDDPGGGGVPGLPQESFSTDKPGLVRKFSTDIAIPELRDKELSDLGFITLCPCKETDLAAFFSSASLHKSRAYDTPHATLNAKMSAMLQYTLCVSRFAHYLKVIMRDKIGSFAEPQECQQYLESWLAGYVTSDSEASLQTKAEYPLREAKIQVHELAGKPGSYSCIVHLRPHFQLDDLQTGIRLVTELAPAQPA